MFIKEKIIYVQILKKKKTQIITRKFLHAN